MLYIFELNFILVAVVAALFNIQLCLPCLDMDK